MITILVRYLMKMKLDIDQILPKICHCLKYKILVERDIFTIHRMFWLQKILR